MQEGRAAAWIPDFEGEQAGASSATLTQSQKKVNRQRSVFDVEAGAELVTGAGAGGGAGGAGERMTTSLGEVYQHEHLKFSILQTLVLVEIIVSTSERAIFALCGTGLVMILFFFFLFRAYAKDKEILESLEFVFPMLLVTSTALLTFVLLLKALVYSEQVDFSLFFLGLAFTLDNVIWMTDIIPRTARHALRSTQGQKEANILGEVQSLGCRGQFVRHMTMRALVDDGQAIVFTLFIILGTALCLVAFVFTGEVISLVVFTLVRTLPSAYKKWEKECTDSLKRNPVIPLQEFTEVIEPAARNAVLKTCVVYSCVLAMDICFVAVVCATSALTGGMQSGGVRSTRP